MGVLNNFSQIVEIIALVVFAVPVVLIGVTLVLVVSNRADPDPSGRRPLSVYLFAASFVSLFGTLLATFGIVAQLCRLIASGHSSDSTSGDSGSGSGSSGFFRVASYTARARAAEIKHPLGDSIARNAVLLGVLAIVLALVYVLHSRAARRISAGAPDGDPVARVRQSYVSAVLFVCVLIVVISLVVAVYRVFGLISPTVFNPDAAPSHSAALRALLPAAFLGVATALVLAYHLRSLPPGQRPDFSGLLPKRPTPPPVDGPYDLTGPQTGYDLPGMPSTPPPTQPPAGSVTPQPPTFPPPSAGGPAGSTEGGEVLGTAPRLRPRPRG